MRYGQIRQYDIANGEGIRTSIFVTIVLTKNTKILMLVRYGRKLRQI